MYLYSIYTDSKNANACTMIIKQGFSVWALIFNFFWAIYHKMWLVVVLILIANLVIIPLEATQNIILIWVCRYIKLLQLLVFGLMATELRECYATKRGWKLDDIILAYSKDEAEIKYISRKSDIMV